MSKDFTVHSSIHDYSVDFVDDFEQSLQDILEPNDMLLIDEQIFSLYRIKLESICSTFPSCFP